MKIILPLIAAYKNLVAILATVFSLNNLAGFFKKEDSIQCDTVVAGTTGTDPNNKRTITKTIHTNNNNTNDVKQCDTSFSFLPIQSLPTSTSCFMKTVLRKSGVFAVTLLIANLLFVNTSNAQVTQLVNWTKGFDAGAASSGNINFAIPTTSTNRVLVVGVTASVTSSTGYTVNTLTYGGQALINATSTMTSSGHVHTAFII